MSQNLFFYKITVFSEEVTQDFPRENVYDCVRSLFRGGDMHATDFIDKHFENLSITSMSISASAVEKILPKFSENLKYIFDSKSSAFFMVDEKLWSVLEKITEQNIRDIFQDKKQAKITDRLKENFEISSEYAILLELFKKKMLFANIF